MSIHLLVPGLSVAMAEFDLPARLARLPALRRILSCADRQVWAADFQRTLFRLLALDLDAGSDPPTAAVALLGEGEAADGCWLHADPVLFRAEGDQLLLFGADALEIRAEEAAALAAAFDAHFADDGLRLHLASPDRWYLASSRVPAIRTSPLLQVIGRNIDSWLPRGEDAPYWRRLINETQMLFHQHPVNGAREAAGRLPISGLWFSGNGALPAVGEQDFGQLVGEGPLLQGLAKLADIPLVSFTGYRPDLAQPQLLLYSDLLRPAVDVDVSAWQGELQRLEQCLQEWLSGQVAITLYPGNGLAYRWRPVHKWRFWRRKPVLH